MFPPAIIGSAIVGAGAGALTGHLSRGISRGDLKELGAELETGTAAVIVLGESKIEEQLDKARVLASPVARAPRHFPQATNELRRNPVPYRSWVGRVVVHVRGGYVVVPSSGAP